MQGGRQGYRAGTGTLFLKRAILGFAKKEAKSRIKCRFVITRKKTPALPWALFTWVGPSEMVGTLSTQLSNCH